MGLKCLQEKERDKGRKEETEEERAIRKEKERAEREKEKPKDRTKKVPHLFAKCYHPLVPGEHRLPGEPPPPALTLGYF